MLLALNIARCYVFKNLAEHYKYLKAKSFFPKLIEYITSGHVVYMAWEGVRVVASARKLIGATNPLQAEPGTIRGDLDVKTGRNVVHGSDSPENGEREIDPDEISELGTPRHRVHEREDGSRFRSDNALTNTTRDKYPHVSGSEIYTLDRHVRRLSMESVKSDLSSVRVDGIPNMMSRAATARTDDLIARLNQEVIVRQFLRKKWDKHGFLKLMNYCCELLVEAIIYGMTNVYVFAHVEGASKNSWTFVSAADGLPKVTTDRPNSTCFRARKLHGGF
ncbi:hypothetical protein ACFE04_027495 [Oxalis oulophora]